MINANTSYYHLNTLIEELRHRTFCESDESHQRKLTGLTVRQAAAIRRLRDITSIEPEGVSLKKLATHLQMTVPATSLLVESMSTRGFFERRPNPSDRRAVLIRLAAKGSSICDTFVNNHCSRFNEIASVLTMEEKEQFAAIVNKLHTELQSQTK